MKCLIIFKMGSIYIKLFSMPKYGGCLEKRSCVTELWAKLVSFYWTLFYMKKWLTDSYGYSDGYLADISTKINKVNPSLPGKQPIGFTAKIKFGLWGENNFGKLISSTMSLSISQSLKIFLIWTVVTLTYLIFGKPAKLSDPIFSFFFNINLFNWRLITLL